MSCFLEIHFYGKSLMPPENKFEHKHKLLDTGFQGLCLYEFTKCNNVIFKASRCQVCYNQVESFFSCGVAQVKAQKLDDNKTVTTIENYNGAVGHIFTAQTNDYCSSNINKDIQKQNYIYLRHDVLHLTASLVGAIVVAESVQHLLVLELVLV